MSAPDYEAFNSIPPEGLPDIVELSIPEEIDDEWCAEFRERYGNGMKRILTFSQYCLLQTQAFPKRFESIDVIDHTQSLSGGMIEGRIIGTMNVPEALIVPDFIEEDEDEDDDEKPLIYEQHIVLDEVIANGKTPLTSSRFQQVMIPFEPGGSIILFD